MGVIPKQNAEGGRDYWEAARIQALGNEEELVCRLLALEACLPLHRLDALAPYVAREDFLPEKIKNVSTACAALCSWARMLYKYHSLTHAKAASEAKRLAQRTPDDVIQAAAESLNVLSKASIVELKSLTKPPRGVDTVLVCVMHLLTGFSGSVALVKRGSACYPRDRNWKGCRAMLGDVCFLVQLMDFKAAIDELRVPHQNVQRARKLVDRYGPTFSVEEMSKKSLAAAGLCAWVLNVLAYYDIVTPVPLVPSETRAVQAPASTGLHEVLPASRDVNEVKVFCKPPVGVMKVCLCIMELRPLGNDCEFARSWAGCQKMLGDTNFVAAMRAYRPENVSEAQRATVRSILDDDDLFSGSLKAVSKAAFGLLEWVRMVIGRSSE